jgi:formate hydrogenlyase subunit 3/multisubunit Na+/H+ antiporter MnhD subunit
MAVVVPMLAAVVALVLGGRSGERIHRVLLPVGLAIAAGIAVQTARSEAPLHYHLGGWAPPLGVALRADWASAAMLLVTAVVMCAVGLYARGPLGTPKGVDEARAPYAFWVLLPGVWAGLNAVFLCADLFSGYVALELLTFGAVPLVCLDGRGETLDAALRYLLFALLGSMLYLVGTALLYGTYGTLDIGLLSRHLRGEPALWIAIALMTTGLLAKTALFPLHLWLPPAHAGAPAPASAVLSALVVKGPFFLVVRLWLDVLRGGAGLPAAGLLAALGAAAILFGNALALRQARLKLMIAYSTVAQLGYLFLIFPLAASPAALTGGVLQAINHALAKAAMFLAAGLLAERLGHDRVAGLGGAGRALPIPVLAFALAGVALVGLPPSGAFLAKWLLVSAAAQTGQGWLSWVTDVGALLTSAYVFVVLARAFATPVEPLVPRTPPARHRDAAALALAVLAVLLGLAPLAAPGSASGVSQVDLGKALAYAVSVAALWPVAAGAALAFTLSRRTADPSGRGVLLALDRSLRQWPVAGVSLAAVALSLGAAFLLRDARW